MSSTLSKKIKSEKFFLSHILLVLIVLSAVYLTPLKNINVIEPVYRDIDPKQFYEEFSQNPNKYIFIDVRDAAAYNSLHAKGSISMPLHTLYDQRKTLPKKDKTIVLICSGGRASGVGYMYLQHYGFFNLLRISGGIENWVNEGLPTEGMNRSVSFINSDMAKCKA